MDLFSKFKNFRKAKDPPPPAPPMPMEELIDHQVGHVMEAPPPKHVTLEEEETGEEIPAEPPTVELELADFGLDDLLVKLVEMKGSDLHLESGAPPVFRIRGDMCYSNLPTLSNEDLEQILLPLVEDRERKTFEKVGNLDLAHEIPGLARFRVNLLRQYNGIGAVLRVIPSKIPTVEQLNLPPVLIKLAKANRGIIIVTGPTGSGKSTTMAAMINYLNENRKGHIITIEDPIEFTHTSINCLIDHRQVGHHTRSFAEALKAALREDPDIILVGEMRDLETIALAITAAEMGVLVFGTLHTNSASKTIDRIIDVFPSKQQEQVRSQLSQSLRGIVAQQLLKTADGQGRCAVVEVLICNMGLANLIREGKTNQISSFIQMGKDEGMITMDDALLTLVESGKITPQLAYSRSIEKHRMKSRLGIR